MSQFREDVRPYTYYIGSSLQFLIDHVWYVLQEYQTAMLQSKLALPEGCAVG